VPKGAAVLLSNRGAGSKFEPRHPCFVCSVAAALFRAAAATASQAAPLCTGHSSLQDGREPICGLGLRLIHGPLFCSSVDVALNGSAEATCGHSGLETGGSLEGKPLHLKKKKNKTC